MKQNKVKIIVAIVVIAIILAIVGIVVAITSNQNKNDLATEKNNDNVVNNEEPKGKVDIVDVNSKTRPYAIVVNNTPVAVKVQEGLNKAYMVYQIPTEGNTSRLIGLYKDIKEDLVVGTIRSVRHNFLDFALESDAIFVCFGQSTYADNDLKGGLMDYFNGFYSSGPFYRSNPENLATEHTAYTSIGRLKEATTKKGYRTTSDDSILLNYNIEDTELSSASNTQVAKSVSVPYGGSISTFKYDEKTKMYTRYADGTKCVDHKTKEDVTTKNIIVQKIEYKMCDDNYCWDLKTIGSGDGYYITNGYAVPITWSKSSRSSKTKYTYKEGTTIDGKDVSGQEVSVSDGRTWITVQTVNQKLTIE